jgi:hypothetical protein
MLRFILGFPIFDNAGLYHLLNIVEPLPASGEGLGVGFWGAVTVGIITNI